MKTVARKRSKDVGNGTLADKRRDAILTAAAKLFAEHGYDGADTQLLADRLRVGKGTLYRYFRSKEALFLATVDRVMREICQQTEAAIEGIVDPLDQIAGAVVAYLTFFSERPEAVELLMQERAQFKDRKKPTYFEHREENIGRWLDLYRSLIKQGRVRKMPVERITDVMSGLLYGVIFTNYFTGVRASPKDQARDILDVFFRGILSEAELRARGRQK